LADFHTIALGSEVAAFAGMASEVVRWVLSDGTRQLTCVTRTLAEGSELAVVYYDGLPLRTRVCANDADGLRWTNSVRSDWMAHGWTPTPDA
jgi:hypothetical protein